MDRRRFDALTRLLGAEGTRRSALGAVVGAALLGSGLESSAKKGKNKRKNKGKNKQNNQPQTCFGTLLCEFPGPALDFENCNFAFTEVCAGGNCSGSNFRNADLGGADMEEGNFQGASFREANLRSANLENADVSGASFRDACLAGANFLGANMDGAHFGDAILCGTTLPDGAIDDSGCDDTDDCCPPAAVACLKEGDCPVLGDTCCEGSCCPEECSCLANIPGSGDVCVDTDIGDCDFPCDEGCPAGWACIDEGGCEFAHCHPLCGTVVEESRSSRRGNPH